MHLNKREIRSGLKLSIKLRYKWGQNNIFFKREHYNYSHFI